MNPTDDEKPIESNAAKDAPASTDGPPVEGRNDADESVEYDEPQGRIGWKKGLLIVVAVVVVWTFVEARRRIGWEVDWSNDLKACLARAQDPRKAILLLVHKRDCQLMKELDVTVFSLKWVVKWTMEGIPCRLIWEEHSEVVKKYDMTESPTLLVLNPKGDEVYRWSGEAITDNIRARFLRYAVGETDEGTYRKPTSTSAPSRKSP